MTRITDEQLAALEGHTPGPWYVGYTDGSGCGENGEGYTITIRIKDDEIDDQFSVVSSSKDDWGVTVGIDSQYDAALIAAAPLMRADLIEARKAIKMILEDWREGQITWSAINRCRKVIGEVDNDN